MTDHLTIAGTPEDPEDGIPVSMSARQRELHQSLAELDSELAGLFRMGIQLSNHPKIPGGPLLLAHVGRELILAVLSAAAEDGKPIPSLDSAETPEGENHRLTIAHALGIPTDDPRVSLWFDLYKTFVRAAHYRRGARHADADLLRVAFRSLEELLFGMVGPYFQTQEELDQLLAVESPGPDQARLLATLLLRPQQRRYFFGHLKNPAWLPLLREAGVFSHPPERFVNDDGSWRVVFWPPGEYLIRVAEERPNEVVEILREIPNSLRNPEVWRIVAQVAGLVPIDLARPLGKGLARGAGFAPFFFMEDLLKVVSRLAEVGDRNAVAILRMLLFVPKAEHVSPRSQYSLGNDWAFPRLDHTSMAEVMEVILPALAKGLPEQTLELLSLKIARAISLFEQVGSPHLAEPGRRSGIRSERDDSYGHLLEAFDFLLSLTARESPEVAEFAMGIAEGLEGTARKVIWYRLLAGAPTQFEEHIDRFVSSEEAVEPGPWARYAAEVLRNGFSVASLSARRIFAYSIHRGPSADAIQGRLEWLSEEATEPKIEEIRQGWQRRRLTWFRGKIPEELASLAESLGLGPEPPSERDQELAEVGFYSGGVSWGSPSDYSVTDLDAENEDSLLQLLRTWEPKETPEEPGTRRGLELAVQELAKLNPGKAAGIVESASGTLPFGFVRAVMDGLRDRVRDSELGVDATTALRLISHAIERGEEQEDLGPGDRRALFWAALELLSALSTSDLIEVDMDEKARSVVRACLNSEAVWDEAPMDVDSFGAILTAALNHNAPRTVSIGIQLELSIYRREHCSESNLEGWTPPDLSHLFAAGDGRPRKLQTLCEATLGQFLPQLFLLSPDQVGQHLDRLLTGSGSDPLAHPAWAAYVTRAQLFNDAFAHLRPWYLAAAESASGLCQREESDERWSPTEGLLKHILVAVLRGWVDPAPGEKLLELTFNRTPVKERGRAYWSVFRGWSDAEEPPPQQMIDRLVGFWEWRLDVLEPMQDRSFAAAEAHELGWFIHTPHVPADSALDLGVRTARLAGGDLELQLNWTRFGGLAEHDPDKAINILDPFIRSQLKKEHPYVSIQEVRPILEVFLSKGDPDTGRRTTSIIHKLGEAGYTELQDLA